MLKVIEEHSEIVDIEVDGEKLHSDDGELWFIPKNLTHDIAISDLPENVDFQPCRFCEDSFVHLDSIPLRIRRIAPDKVRVCFEDFGTRKYWDGKIGFKRYMEAKKAVVDDRQRQVGDVTFDNYDDDGAWIWLTYMSEIEADSLQIAIELAEQLVDEIEGATELQFGGEIFAPESVSNEKEFTLHIVLPILRKLGFINVRYNHGKREFGKDILFARHSEFHDLEHWGAQVKFGDISGEAGSELNTLIGQVDDAFKMPFYDLYTRQQQSICKLVIVASGKFTENAIEKVCEKIESRAIRNNLIFVDGQRLETLAEMFRK